MIDLHCHLCFGVDDGPKSAKDSVELARALLGAGVTQVACTPHIRPNKHWNNYPNTQDQTHSALDAALDDAGVSLPRVRGAEHYFDPDVLSPPHDEKLMCYGDTNWVLIELPYNAPPVDLLGPLFRIRSAGYRVLLAHIERYPYVVDHDDRVDDLLAAGHVLQVNLGSLAGQYARAHKKAAAKLVSQNKVKVACGDCHNARDVPKMIEKGRKALRKLVGDVGVKTMCETNPGLILQNAEPEVFA